MDPTLPAQEMRKCSIPVTVIPAVILTVTLKVTLTVTLTVTLKKTVTMIKMGTANLETVTVTQRTVIGMLKVRMRTGNQETRVRVTRGSPAILVVTRIVIGR